MEILIESTKHFEKDISSLNATERDSVIKEINHCAELFETGNSTIHHKLRRIRSLLNPHDCNFSSLYALRVSQHLRVILTVDDDPIFKQAIFTLFRVVNRSGLEKAYQGIAESLYQKCIDTTTNIAA